MNFDLPASLESELKRYAAAEHLTVAEAATKFITLGLKAKQGKGTDAKLTPEERRKIHDADPGIDFFAGLPGDVIDGISEAMKQSRAERKTPRG